MNQEQMEHKHRRKKECVRQISTQTIGIPTLCGSEDLDPNVAEITEFKSSHIGWEKKSSKHMRKTNIYLSLVI